MWTRKELKTRAKGVLKISYWKAFVVSLVIGIVGGNGGNSFNFGNAFDNRSMSDGSNGLSSMDSESLFIILLIAGIFSFIMLFVLALRIFLGYPLEVGGRRYFNQSAQGEVNMGYLGYSFDHGRYGGIIKAMLWRMLLNFLWYLLLIIPGIVKSYAYQMVPYILADNPRIGYKRAVELSKQMTAGQKWRMFVLDLSFIGWYLLGVLVVFVGVLFVLPYDNATKSELYLTLRQKALDEGVTSHEELALQPPIQNY